MTENMKKKLNDRYNVCLKEDNQFKANLEIIKS